MRRVSSLCCRLHRDSLEIDPHSVALEPLLDAGHFYQRVMHHLHVGLGVSYIGHQIPDEGLTGELDREDADAGSSRISDDDTGSSESEDHCVAAAMHRIEGINTVSQWRPG